METITKTQGRILNCIPSRGQETDWLAEVALQAYPESLTASDVPNATDLRAVWWKVNDQGNTGSCVGWAAANGVILYQMVTAGYLNKQELLSTRYLWMASKELDQWTSPATVFIEMAGTSLKAALDIARRYGLVKEQVLPFKGNLFPGRTAHFYALASQLKIASYFNLGRSIENWKRWIAMGRPVLTRLNVDKTFANASQTNGKLDVYLPETADGGHAIALVGYTQDHFIVRNSWGSSWGDGGFGFASMAYAQAAFTENYGVTL